MAKTQSLQDPFLNALRKERVPVSIYLVNGIKLQGTIDSFDQFVVLLKNSVNQMVYKHAISTVVPARNVRAARWRGRRWRGGCRATDVRTSQERRTCRARAPRPRGAAGSRRSRASSRSWRFPRAPFPWPPSPARRERPDPRYFVGSGKAEQIRLEALAHEADVILVDHPLSPSQERNLEKLTGKRVLDRSGLILDIFAQRAKSHEGKLEVELAQLKHIASRLVRGWTHLERQRGGSIGLRGPGETQLETDRRLLGQARQRAHRAPGEDQAAA